MLAGGRRPAEHADLFVRVGVHHLHHLKMIHGRLLSDLKAHEHAPYSTQQHASCGHKLHWAPSAGLDFDNDLVFDLIFCVEVASTEHGPAANTMAVAMQISFSKIVVLWPLIQWWNHGWTHLAHTAEIPRAWRGKQRRHLVSKWGA